MAFLNRVSNLLKLNVCKQVSSVSYAPRPSVFQAIRCMSSYASTKLFVGGLSWGTDEQTLREAFSQYGTVLEARIIQDRETGRSRGFGFVTFDTSEAANSAIQALDGQDLQGRNIRVNVATEKPRGGGFGGGGYGGGGGGGGYGGGGGGYGGGGYGGQGGGYGRGGNQGGDGNYGGDVSYGGGGVYGGGGGYGGGGYGGQGGGGYGGQGGGYGRGGNQGGDGNYGGDVSYGGGGVYGGGGQFSSGGSYGDSVQGAGGNYSGSKPGFASLLKDDPSEPVGGDQGPLGGEIGAGNDGFGEDDNNEDGYANTRS